LYARGPSLLLRSYDVALFVRCANEKWLANPQLAAAQAGYDDPKRQRSGEPSYAAWEVMAFSIRSMA
jgi:hypothetical protein